MTIWIGMEGHQKCVLVEESRQSRKLDGIWIFRPSLRPTESKNGAKIPGRLKGH